MSTDPGNPFVEVSLFTMRGQEKHFVVKVKIPRFRRDVELIQWGERFFIHKSDGTYVESEGYWAIVA